MAIVAGLLVIANDGLGIELPNESIIAVSSVAIAYIFGEAYVDGKK